MKKLLALGVVSYLLGGFAVATIRSVQLWDATNPLYLVKLAAHDGLVWPATLLNWIS